jgi:hypothetical protein
MYVTFCSHVKPLDLGFRCTLEDNIKLNYPGQLSRYSD